MQERDNNEDSQLLISFFVRRNGNRIVATSLQSFPMLRIINSARILLKMSFIDTAVVAW
jgi:hypothetical protein